MGPTSPQWQHRFTIPVSGSITNGSVTPVVASSGMIAPREYTRGRVTTSFQLWLLWACAVKTYVPIGWFSSIITVVVLAGLGFDKIGCGAVNQERENKVKCVDIYFTPFDWTWSLVFTIQTSGTLLTGHTTLLRRWINVIDVDSTLCPVGRHFNSDLPNCWSHKMKTDEVGWNPLT